MVYSYQDGLIIDPIFISLISQIKAEIQKHKLSYFSRYIYNMYNIYIYIYNIYIYIYIIYVYVVPSLVFDLLAPCIFTIPRQPFQAGRKHRLRAPDLATFGIPCLSLAIFSCRKHVLNHWSLVCDIRKVSTLVQSPAGAWNDFGPNHALILSCCRSTFNTGHWTAVQIITVTVRFQDVRKAKLPELFDPTNSNLKQEYHHLPLPICWGCLNRPETLS